MANLLFELPIIPLPTASPVGTITCTSSPSSPTTYLLTFSSPPDNRLTTGFIQSLLLALDILETSYPPGVLITTSSIPKFYSNGLDLTHVKATKGFWDDSLAPLFKRFLLFPMPTIAYMPGHAFAGGLMLAMYHDYRIFNPARGFLCLNELEFGVPLKAAMSSIFRQKITSSHTYRSLVLEAHRFGGPEALALGLVDGLGGIEEVHKLIETRKLGEKGKSGIYGVLKAEMYRETLGYLEVKGEGEIGVGEDGVKEKERKRESKERVREWERNTGNKAKL